MASDQPPQDSQPSDGAQDPDAMPINLDDPCKITNVNLQGVNRTSSAIIAKIVANVYRASSLREFLDLSAKAKTKLLKMNAFKEVALVLDPVAVDKDGNSYQATFVVEERKRMTGSVKTSMDEYSGYLDLRFFLTNLFGIGDDTQFSTRVNRRFYSGELSHSVPLLPWRYLWNPVLTLSLSQYQWDTLPSGFNQDDKSAIARVDFLSMPQLQHSVSFENVWRYIRSASPNSTPIEIREQSGHSLKSSIKHTMTWDNRIGGNFPSEGIQAKLSNEFTTNLVNNSARFTRHEASLQYNALLIPKYGLLLQANLLAGTLLRPTKINICDRFFAGGPLTVRGFKYYGLGPNRNGHPLGDMSFLSAGIHLYSNLPYTTPDTVLNQNIRPHVFVNTGTIGDIHDLRRVGSLDDLKQVADRFKNSLRYSCGIGLTAYFLRLRLEVNFCLPLVVKEQDLTARGFQYGIGITYT